MIPSHILIYDGIWWISNFRSIHKDVEKKQIRKITNSKKIPLTIVSNPDRAKKIRQVLHKVGVRVGGKPIANTIQVFRLEDYIYVLKQCGRKEDEYRTLTNVFKKYGKEKPKELEAVFADMPCLSGIADLLSGQNVVISAISLDNLAAVFLLAKQNTKLSISSEFILTCILT